MGVETKKMATSSAAAGGNFGDQIKSWPQRVKSFYNVVRTEMRKVTAPSRKEVQATTTVVLVAIFLFAAYFAIIDYVIKEGMDRLLQFFAK